MRPKVLLPAVAAIVLIALLATFVRYQPSGNATVFRHDRSLAVRTNPFYVRPLAGGEQCRVTTVNGKLMFDAALIGLTATGDEIPLRVRFVYDLPGTLSAAWLGGGWCASLDARVSAITRAASGQETVDALLADRRAAGDRIAGSIAAALGREGIKADDVSVRADVPAGFERLRAVPAVAARGNVARPVIFIGLDGADWQLLDDYMANGTMPNLKGLVATGSGGVLETDYPPLSPLVWTTMMTGVGPLDHGVLDFTRFNPYTHEKEPITSDERRAPAIWNMLTSAGKQNSVFGLWATYAAEPVHGLNVSDRLFTFLYSDVEKPAGVVWPPTRQKWSEGILGAAEATIDASRMREYFPSLTTDEFAALAKSNNPYADPPAALRRILVETEIYRRLSDSYLRERERLPDLTIVYLQGTDTIGHVFAPFAPPKQAVVSQADYDRYNAVPARYFREIDDLLGRYSAIAEQHGAVLMIASDHGFFWREGRPTQISSTATATAAKWHRKEGIFLLRGPGIAVTPGHPSRGSVRQVCATLLALTGMPAQKNGQAPLAGAPQAVLPPLDYAVHFVRAASPPVPSSGRGASEEIAKLKALGYIGSNESARSAAGASSDTRTAGAFNNQGLILRNEHRTDEALGAFDHALAVDPGYASPMWNESETLFGAKRDLDRSDALLVASLQHGLGDAVTYIVTRALGYQREGRAERGLRLLDAAVGVAPSEPELRMFRGRFRMDAHDCRGALTDFQTTDQQRPNNPITLASEALAEMCLGDNAAARASIERSLQLDPNQPLLRQMFGQ
ncbi:MAG TPA: alkaline phosphatase family protein [Thermoanaerobaculia bacterium]